MNTGLPHCDAHGDYFPECKDCVAACAKAFPPLHTFSPVSMVVHRKVAAQEAAKRARAKRR